MSGGLFISYRGEDSAAWADRICERLSRSFGRDHVTLLPVAPISRELTDRVGQSHAVVVLIGKTWLTKTLDDPNDPVRIAIEAALNQKIRVIPVLIDGASMPQAHALPKALRGLARLQPIELSSVHFDSDMERLEEALRNRPINLSGARPVKLPLPDLSDERVMGLKRFAPAADEKSARKSGAKKKPAKKAAAKTKARRSVTKKAARKSAAKKVAAKKTAAMKSAAKKPAAKKPAAKKAARPAPAERDAALAQPRGAVNQDLSVEEMKHFALARVAKAPPDADRPGARAENAQSANSVEEVVECSVFGPPAAPPGGTVLIQVFLHLSDQAERASFLATTMDSSAKLKGTKSLDLPLKRGARSRWLLSPTGSRSTSPCKASCGGVSRHIANFWRRSRRARAGRASFRSCA